MVSWHRNFDDKVKFSLYVYDVNGKKKLQGLPKRWNCLEEDLITERDTHIAIRTGKINNITVLDIDDMAFFEENFDLLNCSTFMDKSYSGKRHLYFKYNEKLPSICFGKFDILSDDKQSLLGQPLNDLPIMEMSKDIETLLLELICEDRTDLSGLIEIMDESFVKRGRDWLAVGQDIKYMGGSLDDWVRLSKKDQSGFEKNFNDNNINVQFTIWHSDFFSCKSFDNFLRSRISEIKKKLKASADSDEQIRSIEEDCYKFAGSMVSFKNGKKVIHDIFEDSLRARTFKCRNILRLAKKVNATATIDWLIENGWIAQAPSYGCIVKNRFNLDDEFYWNDFVRMLTERDVIYHPGQVIHIVCKHLHRVFAFVRDEFIIKKSKEEPFESYQERHFPDFAMHVHSDFGIQTTFLKQLKANPWLLPSIEFKKSVSAFDFRYNEKNTFYCSKQFLATSVESKTSINELLDFIHSVICCRDSELFDYFIKWIAFSWKFPYLKSCKAVLMFSKEGAGKGTLVEFLTKYLFGLENCIPNIDYSDLMGSKTSILSNKKLVCVNELESSRGQKLANQQRLKSLITEDKLSINKLYCNLKTQENRMEFIFMTNNELSLRIDNGDRRYLMMQISDEKVNDIGYFSNLRSKIMNMQCANEFAYFLESILKSPDEFYSMRLPLTEYKKEVVKSSNFDSEFYTDFREAMIDGNELCDSMLIKINNVEVRAWHRLDLYSAYVEWIKQLYPGCRPHPYPKFKKLAIDSKFIEEVRKKDFGRLFVLVEESN